MKSKICIITIKPGHNIYNYMSSASSEHFKFTNSLEQADYAIVAIEETETSTRSFIDHVKKLNKKFLLYFEPFHYVLPDLGHEYLNNNVLNSPLFCGFASHAKSSFKNCENHFKGKANIFYLPVGVPVVNQDIIEKKLTRLQDPSNPVRLLFWGSWQDVTDNNFRRRGGFYVNEIFQNIAPNTNSTLTLKFKTSLPCKERYPDRVNIINKYLTDTELGTVHEEHDIYFLPGIQAHFASVPIAMSYAMPVIGSNNWGFGSPDNNIYNEYNGLIEPMQSLNNQPSFDFPHLLDRNYINNVSHRLTNLINDRDDLVNMAENALDSQRKYHNIGHYQPFIDNMINVCNIEGFLKRYKHE